MKLDRHFEKNFVMVVINREKHQQHPPFLFLLTSVSGCLFKSIVLGGEKSSDSLRFFLSPRTTANVAALENASSIFIAVFALVS
mmetsp:Transcript_15608/g.15005  ORF Transcript_15608/g.15005 Transcript_15608/m.15005 type:complete len:84 (+) Transcript_15608:291-542(+)